MTVICGKNNTGKTYATYALYGFLQSWRDFISFPVSDAQIQSLLTDGGIKIGLEQYVKMADRMLAEACKRYTDELDTVFAAREGQFRNSEFHIQIGAPNIHDRGHGGTIILNGVTIFTYSKEIGSEELAVTLGLEALQKEIDPLFVKKNHWLCYRQRCFFPILFLPPLSPQPNALEPLFFGGSSILLGTSCLSKCRKGVKLLIL